MATVDGTPYDPSTPDPVAALAARGHDLPSPGPTIESAATLLGRTIPPLIYAMADILAAGLAVLAGRPKHGKSWLALALSCAVAAGKACLGHATEQGEVLYLALEDGERRMQGRLRLLLRGDTAPDRLHIAYQWPMWDDGGAVALEDWLRAHPDARAVIIDTWGRIAPAPRARGDAYADTYGTLGGVQALAMRYHVAIVLVTHTRKPSREAGGDYLDAVIGTTAITGAADTVLVLQRDRNADTATLSVTGRDVQEVEIPLVWCDRWMVQSGDDMQRRALEAARRDPVVQMVLAIVAEAGTWTGVAQELLDEMAARRGDAPAPLGWPLTPEAVGKRLTQHAGALPGLGVDMTPTRRGTRREITLAMTGVTGHDSSGSSDLSCTETAPLCGSRETRDGNDRCDSSMAGAALGQHVEKLSHLSHLSHEADTLEVEEWEEMTL